MLSLSFLDVRMRPMDNPEGRKPRWSVSVHHGKHSTRSIELADTWRKQDAKTLVAEVDTTSTASCRLGKQEVEVLDQGGDEDDTVGIALLVESQTRKENQDREMNQSTATINMSTFRDQPDARSTLWLPLQAAPPHATESVGAIKVAIMYCTEDYVAQGYMYALFCGLVPYSWVERLSTWNKNAAGKEKADRIQLHSNPTSLEEAKHSAIATAITAS